MTDVSPVAELIRTVMDEHLAREGFPLSQRDIVRRSGGGIRKSRLNQLLTQPVKRMPAPATIEALAVGLRVDYGRVLSAFLRATGSDPDQRRVLPERIVAALDEIDRNDAFTADMKARLRQALLEDYERVRAQPTRESGAGEH